ncbi:MAG: diaminohydroxyphosphoribosylaminopyrimidine deaminase [Gammaproteobacteria bacterium]|jgi:diaminohydroxyphosphoribosylaminopyrimidine deaminase/5-amino-6-(5-phosphoribosylamino)uracil reductase
MTLADASLTNDEAWMAKAIQIAQQGLYTTDPNPRVGCVITKDDKLITEGWHEFAGGPHAEINAIAGISISAGCDIYVTLEPCFHFGLTPPCVDSLIKIMPARVVVAMQDPNPLVQGASIRKLRDAGISVESGILENQSRALNPGFIKRMESGRPFVRLKMAMTIDGKSALKNGASQWITGSEARMDVQRLRARSSAVLSTAQTVIMDDAGLNVRLNSAELNQSRAVRQPLRVILDSKLKLTGHEKMFQLDGPILIYTTVDQSMARARFEGIKAEVVHINRQEDGRINLEQLLDDLGSRGINELHCECGPEMAGSLISGNLVDELVLYIGTRIFGSDARSLFNFDTLTEINQAAKYDLKDILQLGDDLRLTYLPEKT